MKYQLFTFGAIVTLGILSGVSTAYAQAQQPIKMRIVDQNQIERKELHNERTLSAQEIKNLWKLAGTPEEKKVIIMEAKENREQFQKEATEIRDNFKNQFKSVATQRNLLVTKRFSAVITRTENIIDRIAQRTVILSETGVDTSKIQILVTEATNILEQVVAQQGNIPVDTAPQSQNEIIDMNFDIDTATRIEE